MIRHTLQQYIEQMREIGQLVDIDLKGRDELLVQELTFNSKEVIAGTLFICKGVAFKEQYLEDAISAGAIAYISDKKYDTSLDVPYILVRDIRISMPHIADLFCNSAWKQLKLIGVGGTKGKSTSSYYIKAILDDYLESVGKKPCGIISSIDVYVGDDTIESHITTPEAVELHKLFVTAVENGLEYLVMEVSSQALKYNRVDCIGFDVGIFLNISEDHISPIEHPDFEDYFNSKMMHFALCDIGSVNLDDELREEVLIRALASKEIITFGLSDPEAMYYGYNVEKDGVATNFKVRTKDWDEVFTLTMPGLFNVENALASISAVDQLGIPVSFMQSGLKRARSSGRMELYASKDEQVIAIVDYAHNKLSFEKLYESMEKEYPEYKVITIFGCPGKKALIRRRDLGLLSGQHSDFVYLVAEDPGYEPVEEISRDIAQYVELSHTPYKMIEDRGEAICEAILSAEGKTLILVTGKGNETRQKYGSEYIECPSDVEYVTRYLSERDQTNDR